MPGSTSIASVGSTGTSDTADTGDDGTGTDTSADDTGSTDGGTGWQPLTGRYTTTANPTGNNLGAGYNGQSGGAGGGAQWVREEIDLTPYAGQQVLFH